MTVKLSCNIKYLVLSLLILAAFDCKLFAQVSSLSGTINKYGRVTAIGTNNVTISDNTQFAYFFPGDTVLLIQMKGAECLVPEDPTYGKYQISVGTTGGYEFLTILSVGSNIVTFRNDIKNAYNVQGDIQLIRVPSRNAVNVDGELTCQAWDNVSKTGGVLALFVSTRLNLNANINVKAKGFSGGDAVIGLGSCIVSGGGLNNYSYPDSWQNSGNKGESQVTYSYPGLVPIFPGYSKGFGPNYTGGGGGNGRFSGGGGGALVGDGGKGGLEINTCSTREYGGLGGWSLKNDLPASGVYLGGGGGGSTYLSGATPSSGGRGGGIVIIICETLDGNGKSIQADGDKPVIASGNAGSGGGGAGGTVAVYLQSFSTNVTLSVSGGAGGDNAGSFGEGGGGGGGRLTTNNAAGPGIMTPVINGGSYGTRSGIGHDAIVGSPGERLTTFVPVLNGFLFNSIYSSITKNQVDSICSNTTMGEITGTNPIGGTTPYHYLWESSVISGSAGFSPAPGTNNQPNYTPPSFLAQTTWFRRTITDDSSTPIVDISTAVKIIVHQAITGNIVGRDTTICYGQNPNKLYPLNAGPSNGNGHYVYQWFSNTDNSTWTTNATGASTLASYDPAALTVTNYYRRKVTSGRCTDNSATVTITVLPLITGNITARPDSVICQGSLFNVLGASAAGGGSGSFIYQWQDSSASSAWLPAAGTNSTSSYSADTSKFAVTEDRYYKRVVYSGLNNTCKTTSVPIHLTRYHKIKTNTIAADQTICSGIIPSILSGSSPTGGKTGDYTFQWQDSSGIATWATKFTSQSGYAPAALTTSTYYRRIVSSSKCTSNSNKLTITVHQPIVNNIAELLSGPGPDTTICSGAVPNRIKGLVPTGGTSIPGDYAFLWQYSTDGTSFNDVAVSGTLKDFQPAGLTATTWFRRRVVSGMCSSISNSVRIIVLPLISGNTIATAKPAVCYNTIPAAITSGTLTGGSGTYSYLWESSITSDNAGFSAATGTNNQASYIPPALTVKTWFRRTVSSGSNNSCIDVSAAVPIDILPLPTGSITSVADTALCSGGSVKLRVTLTGSPNWTVVYNENSTQVTASAISASNVTISRVPAVSGSMTTFNYSLASVTDNNGCVATSIAGTRKADVYQTPAANAGADSRICGRTYSLAAVASVGAGLWTFPARAHLNNISIPNAIVTIDSFNTKLDTVTFFWRETNWICTSSDAVKITFDNRPDVVNAGTGGDVVTFDNSILVKALPIASWESGIWTSDSGNGDPVNATSDSTYMRDVDIGRNVYRWTVTNGSCSLFDTVSFIVAQPVIPEGISPNEDGLNDSLKISGIDFNVQEADLKILNSAGTLVFSTSHKHGKKNDWVAWDGKDNKGAMLSEGTYYYLLRVFTSETKHVVKSSGFIILKRH